MPSLWNDSYISAVLTEAQIYMELTQNLFVLAATIALAAALWALVKGA